MDALSRTMTANRDLGARITAARGWRGELAHVHGDKRHPSGFSQHFVDFCVKNGLGAADFLKKGRAGFGGFTDHPSPSSKTPIVLVHGNGCDATTMAPLIEALIAEGYAPHDIYVLSYGKGDPDLAAGETHAPAYARGIRDFLDAVSAYTGRPPDVVGHSKGSTDSQLAIHGVTISDTGIVDRFANRLSVRTFIGAAGANQGLAECVDLPFLPISNRHNGFHPEAEIFGILPKLGKAATKVYSIVARDDELESNQLKTAQVPFQDGQVVLEHGGHMAPIWDPAALVRLVAGCHEQLHDDGYEVIRNRGWWSNPLSPFALTDAMVTASSHFMGAVADMAKGLGGETVWRATAGFATLAHAARAAMTELPTAQLRLALAGGQQAALDGRFSPQRRAY